MKHTAKSNLLESLKSFSYFDKEVVYQIGENESNDRLTKKTLDTYISRFRKHKEIVPLRGGLYVSTDFYNKNNDDVSYLFFLANVLRKPSYVSSWTALQYYNLTTDVIHTVTSVTLKTTRTYKTKIGTFSYQSIKKNLFSDFDLVSGTSDFFIATPAKALFDLLYFKTRQFKGLKFENIDRLIEELRIDIDEMDATNREKFYLMVKNYLYAK